MTSALAQQRAETSKAIDMAIAHLMRAAVTLDTALTHARASDVPTNGPRITLEATIDVLRDQIDNLQGEVRFFDGLAAEALRRETGTAA